MIKHREVYFSDFSNVELYSLVSDIEKYPEFLPWCAAARIIETNGNITIAELVVHFASLYERYTSEVRLIPPENKSHAKHEIIVDLIEGPFNNLKNYWCFEEDQETKKTKVTFEIEFEFQSSILQKLMGAMFETGLKKMVKSFELRAGQIYGEKPTLR